MELEQLNDVYRDFEYPEEFARIVDLNLVNFEMWYLLNPEQVRRRVKGLQQRYPHRKLIPFARRDDCDDIACFEVGKEDRIQIIHDFSTPGYEQRKEYADFWAWLRDAFEEMIERLTDEINN